MAKTVGELIKEARTKAGLSQTALAEKVDGVSGSDIGKAERGEKSLTQEQLKQIAKALGVTQKSLLDAAKTTTTKTTAKTTSTKTAAKTASKTTSSKTSSSKTASSKTSSSKTSSSETSSGTSMKVTATEKKLVELYRAADSDTKKAAMSLLKGEKSETSDILSSLLGNAIEMFANKK